jgi:hypothetical protein
VIDTQGLLPWRAQEFYGRLQREFESLKQKEIPGYAPDNIVLYAAVLTHYVSDGHVPLHAVVNSQRSADEPNRAALAVGSRAVRTQPRQIENCAGADQAGDESARLHVRHVVGKQSRIGQCSRVGREGGRGREFYDDA